MPPAQQQQGSSSDNSMDFLWLIVLIVGGIVLLWYFGHNQISAVVLKLRLYEIYFIEYVLSGYSKIAELIHLPIPNTDNLLTTLSYINSNPDEVKLGQLVAVSNAVGWYLSFPIILIILVLAVITYFTNIASRFRHIYSMDTLKRSEHRIWPQVSPVMKVDLVKKDLDEGAWGMSLTPMLFAKKHKLLIEHRENGKVTVSLNEGAAYRVLSLQLGQFWRDIETLPIHIQALFAIFMCRANQDRENSDKLLNQISTGSGEKLDFSDVKALVAKHKNSKLAKFAINKHAYVLSVMATLLELARTDGVLATAEFLWLKPIDRPMWYMLNSVGRQTAFPEIGGAYAHWIAEKKSDRALRVPMVDQAVKALNLALSEMIYEPEEE